MSEARSHLPRAKGAHHVAYPRWIVAHRGRLLATLTAALTKPQAHRVGQMVSDQIADSVTVAMEYHGGTRSNPSLAHHTGRPAEWHLTTAAPDFKPVADFYGMKQPVAAKVARMLATLLDRPLALLDNAGLGGELKRHPRHPILSSLVGNPKGRNPRGRPPGSVPPDPATRPRISKQGPRRWAVLYPVGRDPNLGTIFFHQHGPTHKSKGSAQKALAAFLATRAAPNPSRSSEARMIRERSRAGVTRKARRSRSRVQASYHATRARARRVARLAKGPLRPNPKGHDPELDAAVRRITAGLRRRGGVRWSVTRGKGSVYGWIYVKSPRGDMTPDERRYLSKLLGLEGFDTVHHQGVMIPPLERDAFVARAEGKHKGPRSRANPKGRKNPTQRETALAAELVRSLGFDGMADEILSGAQTIPHTLNALLAMKGVPESRKILLRTALAALERGYGSVRETKAAGRAAHAAQRAEIARARRHPANPKKRPLRANPRRRDASRHARAAKTFRMWQDRDVQARATVIQGPPGSPRVAVKLGDVTRINYKSDKYTGRTAEYTHKFGRPLPVLVTDADAEHLYLIGGDVRVTKDGLVN